MSHVVVIKTRVHHVAALTAACRRLGLAEPVHGNGPLFSGEETGLSLRRFDRSCPGLRRWSRRARAASRRPPPGRQRPTAAPWTRGGPGPASATIAAQRRPPASPGGPAGPWKNSPVLSATLGGAGTGAVAALDSAVVLMLLPSCSRERKLLRDDATEYLQRSLPILRAKDFPEAMPGYPRAGAQFRRKNVPSWLSRMRLLLESSDIGPRTNRRASTKQRQTIAGSRARGQRGSVAGPYVCSFWSPANSNASF
jgi:hypothetical protein